MFRATMCPSSGETMCLWDTWYFSFHPAYQTLTSTMCRINKVVSPDDGHIVGFIYKCRKSVTTIIIIIKNLNSTNLFVYLFFFTYVLLLVFCRFLYFLPYLLTIRETWVITQQNYFIFYSLWDFVSRFYMKGTKLNHTFLLHACDYR